MITKTSPPSVVNVVFTKNGKPNVPATLNSAQVTALMSTKHIEIAGFDSTDTIEKSVWQLDSNGNKTLQVHLK